MRVMKTSTKKSQESFCCGNYPNWGMNAFRKMKISFLLLLVLSFFFSEIHAQPFINGDPSEWPAILNNPANLKKAFRHDPFQSNGIDDQWTGGSADGDAHPNTDWHWVLGNSNDKGDIANAGAILVGTKLFFFGDRAATNGDAQIGFWFFLGDQTVRFCRLLIGISG